MAPKSVPVPMIRRVRLANFRSIAECDVELGPLTLLVGPNGSGKSNFLHALDFLSDALTHGLETAILHQGGIDSLLSRWALDDPQAALRIELDLELPDDRVGSYALALRRAQDGAYDLAREQCSVRTDWSADGAHDFVLAEFNVDEAGRSWHDARGDQFVPDVFPSQASRTLTMPHFAEHEAFGPVYRAIVGMSFYSPYVTELTRLQVPDSGRRLRSDGSNVASVYERLRAVNERGWLPSTAVVDALSVVTPGIVDILAPVVDGQQVLRFKQRLQDGEPPYTFRAREMSYGTLRTLAILVALYQGSMAGGSPITLVGLEEPESAVHPGIAALLLEVMGEASLTTQVLATTHSSAMLDYGEFDIATLRAVAIEHGRTRIGHVDAAGQSMLEERLVTAGELLRMRHLVPEARAASSPPEAEAAAPA